MNFRMVFIVVFAVVVVVPAQNIPAPSPWDLVGIGQTTADVHRILGEPQFTSKGNRHFEVWTGDLTVTFANGKVVSIKRPTPIVAAKPETETIFMPIGFGPSNTVVFTFANSGASPQTLLIQRYASSGTLMDSLVRTAGVGSTNLRFDVPLPERERETTEPGAPRLAYVTPAMPAYRAGLRKDDRLIRVNGKPVTQTREVQPLILESQGKPIDIVYRRGDLMYTTTVAPELSVDHWVIGIGIMNTDYDISVGWVRVVEEGTAVAVSAISETISGDKLQQYDIIPSPPKYTNRYDFDGTQDFCKSEQAKDFKCDGNESAFFINLSDNPVQVSICFDNPECIPATIETVAAQGMISYPNMRKQSMTLRTTIGYSLASRVFFGEGSTKTFDASSTITYNPDKKK